MRVRQGTVTSWTILWGHLTVVSEHGCQIKIQDAKLNSDSKVFCFFFFFFFSVKYGWGIAKPQKTKKQKQKKTKPQPKCIHRLSEIQMSCTGRPVFLFAKFGKATSTLTQCQAFCPGSSWSVSTNPFGCFREQNPFPLKSKQQVAMKLGRILTLWGTRSDTPALTTALIDCPMCSVLLFLLLEWWLYLVFLL